MKIKSLSIAVKTIVPIMFLLILVATILIISPTSAIKKSWHQNELQTVEHQTLIVMKNIQNDIDKTAKIANSAINLNSTLQRTFRNTNPRDISQIVCNNAINQLKADYIAVYDPQLNLLSPQEIAGDSSLKEAVVQAAKGNQYSGIVLSDDKTKSIAVTAIPLKVNGQIVTILEVGIDCSKQEELDDYPKTVGCEISYIYDNKIFRSSIEGRKGNTISTEVYEKLKNNEKWEGVLDVRGEDYTAVYWPYPGVEGFSLFIGSNVEMMNQVTKTIGSGIFAMECIANLSVLIIFAILFTLIILRPLKRTNKAIEELSTGDADLTYRIPVKGNDELAQLAKGVNKFIELLQSMMKQIQENSNDINDVILELGSSSQQTASATTEIMANIESVKNQAKNQANAVLNTNTIIQESNTSMNKLEHNVVAQTSDITESSAAIEEMIGNINSVSNSTGKMSHAFSDLAHLITEGSTNVVACSQVISQVEEKSKILNEANNTIKSISSQTNLLAMNAMIESAHAGEAGKGFAVVADEIRKLAENSGTQAKAIEENIKEISNLINEGGRLANLSQESFAVINNQVQIVDPIVSQISNAMDEQTAGSSQILEALSNMKSESVTVDDSCKELDSGINKIKDDMLAVSEISSTILGSMDEMAAGSGQISKATQQVSELALKTKDAMETINQLIGKFKV
ncbi:MAG: methyl-accepting chemotaxis protein [Treponema sp.]|nr:methyl-accepting chemotaxis protein [Treponema sp.]